jgi:16S rRNA (guanine(966)-N(2))-methyltransferase RsmD
MRIIGGTLKGIRFHPPIGLPTRPTTDRSKEALFNILNNQIDFDGINALDLFSGTGNISIELASRGAASVLSVDTSFKCCSFIKEIAKKHQLNAITILKEDALKFIKRNRVSFDFIFADPPFDMTEIPQLPSLIFDNELLNPGGLLIIEHPSKLNIDKHPAFFNKREYGFSAFSFFKESEGNL